MVISVDLTFKILLLGIEGIGKSKIISKYIGTSAIPKKKGIGLNISIKNLVLENFNISLQIWDLDLNENLKFLFSSYAKGTSGLIYLYDLTNKSSFDMIIDCLKDFRVYFKDPQEDPIVLIVGINIDLDAQTMVSQRERTELLSIFKINEFYEISVINTENVEKIFTELTLKILKKFKFL